MNIFIPAVLITLFQTTMLSGMGDPPTEVTPRPHHQESIDPNRFTTDQPGRELPLPEEEDMFTFIVFGDRTGGPAEGVNVLKQAVSDANLFEPDMVMTVGDLIQGYSTTGPWMEQMQEFRAIMDKLLCPWFPVAGNHDVYWRGSNRPPQEHEHNYQEHFGPLWYAFDHKDCRFITLYTDEADPKTGERNFSKPGSQQMSAKQLEWLKKTLEDSRDTKHVFVFLHHPRWLGGNYGDDWENVHQVLAKNGNVRACFAGHIHYMRHDGVRDGIEYVTLATVGGGQRGTVPKAGYLHQYHVVTVRPNGMALAAIPVGEVMDVRALDAKTVAGAAALAKTVPAIKSGVLLTQNGSASGTFEVYMNNPTNRSIDFELTPHSHDSRWNFSPDHVHGSLDAGEMRIIPIDTTRTVSEMDSGYRPPVIHIDRDYLTESARYPIPQVTASISVKADLQQPKKPDANYALELDGVGQHVAIESQSIQFPDGPFTLETWFNAEKFPARCGLICKTESSEYGFFISGGIPEFDVHLNGAYVAAVNPQTQLSTDTWHHIAGVYDGREVRLYVDGVLVSQKSASGKRTRREIPLIIGGDVNASGEAASLFPGRIDGVRISNIARYHGASFTPELRHMSDDDTVLLLNFDADQSGWVFDESNRAHHPRVKGGPSIVRSPR